MTSGRRHFERALGAFLTFDVGQVEAGALDFEDLRLRPRQHLRALEVVGELDQRGGRNDLDVGAGPGSFGPAFGRAHQAFAACIGADRGRQYAGDRCNRAVEAKLAQNRETRQRIMRNGADRRHQAERDRQIVMAAFLRQIGRREIDGDAARRQSEAGGDQRGAHALARLGHRLVGQPDNGEGRQAWRHLYLDVDGTDLDALERHRGNALDHDLPQAPVDRLTDPGRPSRTIREQSSVPKAEGWRSLASRPTMVSLGGSAIVSQDRGSRSARQQPDIGGNMVQLADGDIGTREVLTWKGVHVLHFSGSSCSQKLRVFLNLKGIDWVSHPVDLPSYENLQPWFLGINPRGLVPVLVHDGAVHIESNDIIQYLEKTFPQPRLIPAGHENEVAALLKHEDDLHLDLRTLSFRFVFAPPGPPKSAEALASYAKNGSGTVGGLKDREKEVQIEFWQRAAREGFTDERARASAQKFRAEFDALDKTLARQPYLMGADLSVLDIAWFIYANRLSLASYPFARLHPHVHAWAEKLRARPEFAKEIGAVRHSAEALEAIHRKQQQAGKTLEQVAGF